MGVSSGGGARVRVAQCHGPQSVHFGESSPLPARVPPSRTRKLTPLEGGPRNRGEEWGGSGGCPGAAGPQAGSDHTQGLHPPDHLHGDRPAPEPRLGGQPLFGKELLKSYWGQFTLWEGLGVQTEGSPVWLDSGRVWVTWGARLSPSPPALLPSGHWTKWKACLARLWPDLCFPHFRPHLTLPYSSSCPPGEPPRSPQGPPMASGSPQDCLPDRCLP